ncbi:exported hypothetical protein [uncultured Alphaproteobacteria bacterium]|uniref:Lipoprotein n=1 Tax=uncultured Alphaproteobacteria bacterium TaxID=91750 RepID=A0A212JZT9_9PROT|nr:exported hypothetical protein [uncultured Alphaproteobacteria bacterium]
MEGKNMKLSAITVMTALSALMLSGCGDSTVKNFNDLHPGISLESASKFLDKYANGNNCERNTTKSKRLHSLTCESILNLDIKVVSSPNIFDFSTTIYSDEKNSAVIRVDKSANLTNKADMDRAFDEVFSNAQRKYGTDGWSKKTTEPRSIELPGRTATIWLKSISMTKTIKDNIKKSVSKAIVYTFKETTAFLVMDVEESF